jgi:aspartate-semialdehyde dehydrogenase
MRKIRVGILGATGMVGQRFVSLLAGHPWFEVTRVAASPQSAGKLYAEAVKDRWKVPTPLPDSTANLRVQDVEGDLTQIAGEVDLVFSAWETDKERIKEVEARYAQAGVAVVSNNSAHRWTEDVPMIMPELNASHIALIDAQRKRYGWSGLIAVKPNCSLQSYLPIVCALMAFGPTEVSLTTLQALSGAGKTFEDWPHMTDNVIPYIAGEEDKTEREPMKILGHIKDGKLEYARTPTISATCVRVPVTDGHMASIAIRFERKPSLEEIKDSIRYFPNPLEGLQLPSAPAEFITLFDAMDRPQTRLDREVAKGMGIACGRFREDPLFHWKCITLVHNTIRGAAGGAILTAELLVKKGYIQTHDSSICQRERDGV